MYSRFLCSPSLTRYCHFTITTIVVKLNRDLIRSIESPMQRSEFISSIDDHIARVRKDTTDLTNSLFPQAKRYLKYDCKCVVSGCNNSTGITCTFMSTPIPLWITICKSCYEFAAHRIIDSWNYDDLRRRIISTRNYKIDYLSMMTHKICDRCGVHSSCYGVMSVSTAVCINCCECAFGHKCRFVNLVLTRTASVDGDVRRFILLTLHQLYMPNYKHINDQVKVVYERT